MKGIALKAGDVLLKLVSGAMVFVVTWAGWATTEIVGRPDTGQVAEMIRTQAPYVEDRKAIEAQLSVVAENSNQLRDVIQKNTDAIVALRVELSRGRE